MTAEIETKGGVASMMYAGETPWHGLGTHVEKEVTASAAIKLAGLDWICEKRPVFIRGVAKVDGIPVIGKEVKDLVAVVRQGDDQILGMVSPKYEIIQNHECFGFMDEVVGSGQAVYHTAGSLRGGSVLFCTLKFPGDTKIGDDLVNKYLLLASSHDRSYSLTAFWTPVRVVCSNTLNVAFHGQKSMTNKVVIRHTTGYKDKISEARRILNLNDQYYHVMEQEFNRLLDTQYSNDEMNTLTEVMLPVKNGKELAGVTRKKREKLMELFAVGAGNAKVTGTKWAAFNAVTEFVDHFTTVRPQEGSSVNESRMTTGTFGSGADMKQRAFDLLSV